MSTREFFVLVGIFVFVMAMMWRATFAPDEEKMQTIGVVLTLAPGQKVVETGFHASAGGIWVRTRAMHAGEEPDTYTVKTQNGRSYTISELAPTAE